MSLASLNSCLGWGRLSIASRDRNQLHYIVPIGSDSQHCLIENTAPIQKKKTEQSQSIREILKYHKSISYKHSSTAAGVAIPVPGGRCPAPTRSTHGPTQLNQRAVLPPQYALSSYRLLLIISLLIEV